MPWRPTCRGLRKVLHQDGAQLIATRPTGYVLHLGGDELDLRNFERLAAEGFASVDAGRHEDAEGERLDLV